MKAPFRVVGAADTCTGFGVATRTPESICGGEMFSSCAKATLAGAGLVNVEYENVGRGSVAAGASRVVPSEFTA